jgi:hypothetical protein
LNLQRRREIIALISQVSRARTDPHRCAAIVGNPIHQQC